ncbi:DegT/DnrJ/EryC1/StrS family aminotransferase [Microbaculum marinum]|uniref:DegT/DnrJ/EryC1/StrS family aminotransferase n=1 Tax=Microbaculum marinum TaxID=1764581 RepID=A0AAW9RVC0_9HYPH
MNTTMLRSLLGPVKPIARKSLEAVNIDPRVAKAVLVPPKHMHGGPPTRRMPWPRRRHFGRDERQAVLRLMDREIKHGGAIVYNGPEKLAYCSQFSDFMGGGYTEAVSSGTVSVYVALRALDLEPGSEVIVPPITDAGGTMPVVMCGCVPVPADSLPGTFNTGVDQIRAVLSDRTRAIVIAHIAGHAVDMDPILELARERDIPILEDCAQAHGASYKGRKVGTFGSVAAFSTMFGKHHSTGAQGGTVYTRDTMIFARARQVTDRGKPYGAVMPDGNVVASLNFNQDEISLAIGRVQLGKLPGFLDRRRNFAQVVRVGLADCESVEFVAAPAETESAYWFLMLRVRPERLSCTVAEFAAALALEGIGGVNAGYPFYPTDSPWHRDANVFGESGFPWSLHQEKPRHYQLPNAHAANARILRVEVHEDLGAKEAGQLVAAVKKLVRYFAKT